MNKDRVIQIIESPGVTGVSYHGFPVWLEGVKGDNARVRNMENNKMLEVPLNDLQEGI